MRTRPTLGKLIFAAARDPWVLLTGSLVGGLGWAVGVPALLSSGVGLAAVAVGGTVAVLTGTNTAPTLAEFDPKLKPGTAQAKLVQALDGYIVNLRTLRESRLPDSVTDSAIEALVAAENSRTVAVRVAAAVDALDAAVARSVEGNDRWSGSGSNKEIAGSLTRMRSRRDSTLVKLDAGVGEVAEVYTKLLELSATVESAALGEGGDVGAVSDSLDSLRTAFASLDAETSPRGPGELTG